MAELRKTLGSFLRKSLPRAFGLSFDETRFPDERERFQASQTFLFQIAYILTWLTYVGLYAALGAPVSAIVSLVVGILPSVVGILALRRRRSHRIAARLSNFGSALALALICLTTGGAHSAVLIWLVAVLVGSYLQLGKDGGNAVAAFVVCLVLFVGLWDFLGGPLLYELPFPQGGRAYLLFNVYNVAFTALVSGVIITLYVNRFEGAYAAFQESERKVSALNAELFELANTDELTRLLNRRALLGLADQELQRTRRRRASVSCFQVIPSGPSVTKENVAERAFKASRRVEEYIGVLSVAMIDLDFFKKINDAHGHETGDRVLAHFASWSRSTFRESDIVGRYGGEEFVVVFPDTGSALAELALGKLRKTLERETVPLSGGDRLTVTFSAGLTESRDEDESMADLLARADAALYRAKAAGRNRVEIG